MYWAICMVFSSAPAIGSRTWLRGSITFVAGMVVGCLFRPHIMIVWAGAVLAIGLLRRRRFWVAILSAVALLLALKAFTIIANVDTSVEGALEYADQQSRVLSATKGGTNIEHGPGGPVMFLSGFVTLFFSPVSMGDHKPAFAAFVYGDVGHHDFNHHRHRIGIDVTRQDGISLTPVPDRHDRCVRILSIFHLYTQ